MCEAGEGRHAGEDINRYRASKRIITVRRKTKRRREKRREG